MNGNFWFDHPMSKSHRDLPTTPEPINTVVILQRGDRADKSGDLHFTGSIAADPENLTINPFAYRLSTNLNKEL